MKDKIENISHDDELPSELMDAIGSIIKKEGYVFYDVASKIIHTNGGNYLGELYQVDVKGKTADGDKDTHIFMKKNLHDYKNTTLDISEVYCREVFVYNELSKIFKKLQDDANVPMHERLNMVKSYDETNIEVIVLENLTIRGYKSLDRMTVIPLMFAEKSIEQLARLHGLSFVLEKTRPEYFEKKIKVVKYAVNNNDDMKILSNRVCDIALENLHEEQKEMFKVFSENLFDKFVQCFDDKSSTVRCLAHGDFRSNNMLAKNYENGEMNIVPVDYQLFNYGCPLNDLIYFIFPATDRKFRKEHLMDLKNLYYESLKRFLEYFAISVEDIYPRKVYEEDFKRKLHMGLIFSVLVLPFILVSEDGAPDSTKDDLTTFSFDLSPLYGERIRELVDEFIEWGHL